MIAHIFGSVLLSIVFLHFKFTSKEKVTFAQDKGKWKSSFNWLSQALLFLTPCGFAAHFLPALSLLKMKIFLQPQSSYFVVTQMPVKHCFRTSHLDTEPNILAWDHALSLLSLLCLSLEEGMIHFFVGSHVKKPESGLFSDWTGNNTDDLHCSDWPKINATIRWLLLISVCIFAYVMSSEYTREFVMKYLPAQFSWIWRMPK